jgi:hypothetical protein
MLERLAAGRADRHGTGMSNSDVVTRASPSRARNLRTWAFTWWHATLPTSTFAASTDECLDVPEALLEAGFRGTVGEEARSAFPGRRLSHGEGCERRARTLHGRAIPGARVHRDLMTARDDTARESQGRTEVFRHGDRHKQESRHRLCCASTPEVRPILFPRRVLGHLLIK